MKTTEQSPGGQLAGYLWGSQCQQPKSWHLVPVYVLGSFDMTTVVVGDGSLPPSTPVEPCSCGGAS